MIYLDNAATTKVFDRAARAAQDMMSENFYNPNATYPNGVRIKSSIEKYRKTIAQLVGTQPDELFFTSCATEANNWVLACGRKKPKGNVVISAGEHSSVYEPAMQLRARGVDVRIAPLTATGAVDLAALAELIDGETTLISIIQVSNETGVINPIREISALIKTKAPRALFHSDGVQGVLKSGIPIRSLGVDFYSASAHKLGAPKGIGFLYVRKGITISPFILGGGQESGLRSGTQNTPYIAAFAEAANAFYAATSRERITAIREELASFFIEHGCKIVGGGENSGYIICVSIPGVKAEILQNLVSEEGVIIGKGAACSGTKRGNRVLSAMGLNEKEISSCIRISMFADTSPADALSAARIIINTADKIRSGHVG